MTLNDNSFTWILAWMCLGVKLILFDHLPPFTAVLKRQQPEKLWKWPFLRHFTAKNDAEWWLLHMTFGTSMSQGQTITVSPFDNYSSTFRTSTTWKTVKIAIFTAKNDTGWWRLHLNFGTNMSQSQTITVWPFCHLFQLFVNMKILKNCQKGPFYVILRHFTALCGQFFSECAL